MDDAMKILCLSCIGDKALVGRIADEASALLCSYCGRFGAGITVSNLAVKVEDDLRSYLEIGEFRTEASPVSDSPEYVQEGESLHWVLQEELEITVEAAQDLADSLIALDDADIAGGEEYYFSSDNNYHRRFLGPGEYEDLWQSFVYRVKHQRRFFDGQGQNLLSAIIGDSSAVASGELPTIGLGLGKEVTSLFRARCVDSESQALEFLRNPARELAPPPPSKATSGRMNSSGIPAFYGALSLDTAIAECRPSIGGIVVACEFVPNCDIKVLDLSRIGIRFTGSIFAKDYSQRASRCRFLEKFHHIVASPVQPNSSALEYLPTQAVAEYVANVLGLQGILYASAQVGEVPDVPEPSNTISAGDLKYQFSKGHNIVLFGSAAQVAEGGDNEVGLSVVHGSVVSRRICKLAIEHDMAYIYDPSKPSPF